MKIKLLSREIEIIAIDNIVNMLEPRLQGKSLSTEGKIYIQKNGDIFKSILHELLHFYLYHTGKNNIENINIETVCEIYPCFLEQLILENGKEIIIKFLEIKE